MCWLSEDFPKEAVAACGQKFGSYRGLTGHWKFIHEPTVNLYQCAGCEKTFLKKPSALLELDAEGAL